MPKSSGSDLSVAELNRIVALLTNERFDAGRRWLLKTANLGLNFTMADWVRRELSHGTLSLQGERIKPRPANYAPALTQARLPNGYHRLPKGIRAQPGDIYWSVAIQKWIPTIPGHITEKNMYARKK